MLSKKLFNSMNILLGYFVSLLALSPIIWMAIAGFKGKTEVLITPFRFLPKHWLISNYTTNLMDPAFIHTLWMTFIGAFLYAAAQTMLGSLAAFAFARLDFPLKGTLWVYIIFTMFIPNMAIMTTSFIVVTKLHMVNTLSVLIIPGAAQAYAMFFIRQFYLNVPAALEEAALIDGSSRFGTYLYIFLPMSLPPFVIIGIGAFLGYWNNYVWPTMTVNDPNLFQVMQYLGTYRSLHGSELGLLMAGSTLAAIPIICLLLYFQRYLVQGIKISGMK